MSLHDRELSGWRIFSTENRSMTISYSLIFSYFFDGLRQANHRLIRAYIVQILQRSQYFESISWLIKFFNYSVIISPKPPPHNPSIIIHFEINCIYSEKLEPMEI